MGRGPENDIVVEAPDVSQRHIRVTNRDNMLWLEDLGSRNGSFLAVGNSWQRLTGLRFFKREALLRLGRNLLLKIDAGEHASYDDQPLTTSHSIVIDIQTRAIERALLVIDIANSSGITEMDESYGFHLKHKLHGYCRHYFNKYQADFIKNVGDGFLATFEDPRAALQTGLDISRTINNRNNRTKNPPLHYRIALHHGAVYASSEQYLDLHGKNVDIAFRIEGLTTDAFERTEQPVKKVDRIFCSEDFHTAVEANQKPFNTDFHYIGSAKLKNISSKIYIYSVE